MRQDSVECRSRAMPRAQMRTLPASPPRRGRTIRRCGSAWRRCGRTPGGRQLPPPPWHPSLGPPRELMDGTYLDAPLRAFASSGNSLGPFYGFVQIFALQHVVARQLFLGFGERPIGGERARAIDADRGGGACGLERVDAEQNDLFLGLLHQSPMVAHESLGLLLGQRLGPFLGMDQKPVAHRGGSFGSEPV